MLIWVPSKEAIALAFLARSGKHKECQDAAMTAIHTPGGKKIAKKILGFSTGS